MDDLLERLPKHLHRYIPGADLLKRGKYQYLCEVCGKHEYGDDPYTPCCTGPHPSLHEHEMTPMKLLAET